MKPAVVILLMLAQGAVSPATQVLQRLQGKISVQPVRLSRTNDLAGVYSDISAELPSLSGQDLYIFPDGTYIYCEWADIEPNTVYDKGKWTVSESSLELVSDPDVR